MRTVQQVIGKRPPKPGLERPAYEPGTGSRRLFLGCELMKYHTADAGWQLTKGFDVAGYEMWGHNFANPSVNVRDILKGTDIGTMVIQDKREWECLTAGQKRHRTTYRFIKVQDLKDRHDIFKVTVLKDCHQRPAYHRESAEEMGVHAWIVYYHPDIVKHFAPFVRQEDLIRMYHTVDKWKVPKYTADRRGKCLLSGAIGAAYPLRTKLARRCYAMRGVQRMVHPGYHARGCVTPAFLAKLSKFKVAICTSSKYGYALRKIIEATAAGCVVVTDLPVEDKLPHIDDNLVRVNSGASVSRVAKLVDNAARRYNADRQEQFANLAKRFYDWRYMGQQVSQQIEEHRKCYSSTPSRPETDYHNISTTGS